MSEKSYAYTAQWGVEEGFIYRPLIDVMVASTENDNRPRQFKALVDSGTEITLMDRSIADLLNIKSDDRPTAYVKGLEAWKPGFIAPVTLRFDKFDQVYTFNVLFTEDLQKNFDIILGQQDFFLNFKVTFKKKENKFYLDQS